MVYLDNCATTKIYPEVKDAMLPYLMQEYGNPSSKFYQQALNALEAVKKARTFVASLLGCDQTEIIFTSGATESNNMIIKGVADFYRNKGNHLVTTKVEHPSVLETCKYLEEKGYEVTYLDVDRFGRIDFKHLVSAIKETTILVSVIWGNNEIGSLNDIKSISEICLDKGVLFHTDATQVVGKVDFNLSNFPGITFLSCSGHKFHGPKGVGTTFVRKNEYGELTEFTPLLHGGGQEQGVRSGTLAVHNIVGVGKAAEITKLNLTNNISHLENLENYLRSILEHRFSGHIKFNNDTSNKIPGILSVIFQGVNNELLLKNIAPLIAASTGSACSSTKPSHVLRAIGLTLDEIRSTVRFSLSNFIKEEDMDIFKEL